MSPRNIDQVTNIGNKCHPNKVAIICESEEKTYGELHKVTNHMAHNLLNIFNKGDRLALLLPNCIEILYSYAACFKTGIIAVPINYRNVASEIEYVLQDTEARGLIIHEERLVDLEQIDLSKLAPEKIWVVSESKINTHLDFTDLLAYKNSSAPQVDLQDDDAACIFYTSGTTGKPKGLVHSYFSTKYLIANEIETLELHKDSISLLSRPCYHIAGFMFSITTLMLGGQVILMPNFEAGEYIRKLRIYKPTSLVLVTPNFVSVMKHPEFDRDCFQSVETTCAGGDKIPEGLSAMFQEITGKRVYEAYGMSEGTQMTVNKSTDPSKTNSIGNATKDTEIKIINKENKEVPNGEVGEIIARMPFMMKEYWRNPEVTNQTIIDGWIHSGDLAYKDDDGYLFFMGRSKYIIVRNGSNISPAEIENIFFQNPEVEEIAVIAKPHPDQGQVPKAFAVLKQGSKLTSNDLFTFLDGKLATYRLPEEIVICDSLPRGKTGKIDKEQLS